MKNTVRISFDVPLEDHTFLKMECAKTRIALGKFLEGMFHKTIEEVKRNKLNQRLLQGIKDVEEGKVHDLGSFAKYADEDEE